MGVVVTWSAGSPSGVAGPCWSRRAEVGRVLHPGPGDSGSETPRPEPLLREKLLRSTPATGPESHLRALRPIRGSQRVRPRAYRCGQVRLMEPNQGEAPGPVLPPCTLLAPSGPPPTPVSRSSAVRMPFQTLRGALSPCDQWGRVPRSLGNQDGSQSRCLGGVSGFQASAWCFLGSRGSS